MPFTAQEALYYDLFCAGDNYAREAEELRAKHPLASTVLEIGAGTGLLTRELIRRDFSVTAIEPSEGMREQLCRVAPQLLIFPETIQQHLRLHEPHRFDLIVAHCDVLNYVPHDEIVRVMRSLRARSRQPISFKIWQPRRGIWPFRLRHKLKAWQIRLAFRWQKTVHVWFFFWGYGFVKQYHRLFLHDPEHLEALNV